MRSSSTRCSSETSSGGAASIDLMLAFYLLHVYQRRTTRSKALAGGPSAYGRFRSPDRFGEQERSGAELFGGFSPGDPTRPAPLTDRYPRDGPVRSDSPGP